MAARGESGHSGVGYTRFVLGAMFSPSWPDRIPRFSVGLGTSGVDAISPEVGSSAPLHLLSLSLPALYAKLRADDEHLSGPVSSPCISSSEPLGVYKCRPRLLSCHVSYPIHCCISSLTVHAEMTHYQPFEFFFEYPGLGRDPKRSTMAGDILFVTETNTCCSTKQFHVRTLQSIQTQLHDLDRESYEWKKTPVDSSGRRL